MKRLLPACGIAVLCAATVGLHAGTFGQETDFLKQHTPLIVLSDDAEEAQLAVAPAWQGRVMTSTADGKSGQSFGWINRELIASGKLQPHINVFGGEDRFWLGPEGGQFSIFFAKGAQFELEDWFTPPALDTMPFSVERQSKSAASFAANFSLTNYSGTRFDVRVNRTVRLLRTDTARKALGLPEDHDLRFVGFESVNQLSNIGQQAWEKNTGLLSVWILGMFNPSSTPPSWSLSTRGLNQSWAQK